MTTRIVAREESLAVKAGIEQEGILAQAMDSPHAFAYRQPQLADRESKLISSAELARLQFPIANTARLEKILELLPSAVIILDSRGRISDCNKAAIELLDGKLQGAYWRDVITANFNPRLDDGHEISLKNGKRVSLVTRSLGDEPGQLIVLNDLTETRALQQQLSRHQRLSAMGRMISSLAHQIRTPLTAALLYADNLQAGQQGQFTEQGAQQNQETVTRYSRKILSRLQNIERQIRDMLIFARGETELNDHINVSELAAKLKEAAGDLQHDKAVVLSWSISNAGAHLLCNADALVGAVLNLLENALQASEANSTVRVSIGVHNESVNANATGSTNSKRISIRVDDEGKGVETEMLDKLDTPFVTTKSHGTGLGLSIVKLVAQAHAGSFTLQPRDERGMCAELQLPISKVGGES